MSKEVINSLREIKISLITASDKIEDLIELVRSNKYSINILEDIEKKFTKHIKEEKTSNKLLTVKEVAKLMHIDSAKVYRLVKGGYIKSLKMGKRGLRIPESEYDIFIKENLGSDISKMFD
ncbi:helix-turn-helix transcriptional regulator [Wukongibacter sp. M2B1]|uniref:helix-turn-helix transcriptional regulator n=1 Tax=Wukongibacter sp. M2B1 TaxID=3088895 RepID=UPI003D7B183E